MIADRLGLTADDALGVAADEHEDRLAAPAEQVENGRRQTSRRAQREDQTRGRIADMSAVEGSPGRVNELRWIDPLTAFGRAARRAPATDVVGPQARPIEPSGRSGVGAVRSLARCGPATAAGARLV